MRRWRTPSADAVDDWDSAGAIGRRTAEKMVIAKNLFQRMPSLYGRLYGWAWNSAERMV